MYVASLSRRLAALAIPVVLAACAAPTGGMQPGLWELTLTSTLDGRAQDLPPVRECISQKDIDDASKVLPRPNGNCSLANVQRSRERAAYDITCTQDARTMQGRAEIRFAGDRYDGNVTMNAEEKGTPALPLAIAIKARRVADCTK